MPAYEREIPFSSVIALQWVRRSKLHASEVKSDMNLLVQENDEVIRFALLHEPTRQQVVELLAFTGFVLEELEVCDTTGWESDSTA